MKLWTKEYEQITHDRKSLLVCLTMYKLSINSIICSTKNAIANEEMRETYEYRIA